MLIQIALIAALILMSGYFSATETAFSSLNKTRLRTIAEKGNRRAELALRLSEEYDKLISTILVGNNIVNIAMASIGTVLFVDLIGRSGATVSTVVITILVLIFGEVSPKSIAKDCPEKFAMFSAPIIAVFVKLLTPVNFLFSKWKQMLGGIVKVETDTKMSQEELLMLVEEVQQDGSIDETEGDLLRNAIEFTDREAEDILTHRVDLEAVPADATHEEVARMFQETKFSRILVYEEDIDHILGVIHQKDFYTGSGMTKKPIRELITPAVFVMQTEKISSLLKKLQQINSHMAVVLDEFGGTYGIVTMEDILEELVGEIWDEHDEVVEDFKKIGPDAFHVDGAMDLEDFSEFFGFETESEVISVSGWVMEQLEKIPVEGDQFRFRNLSVTVTEMDGHRVAGIDVIREPEEEPAEEE